MKVSDEVLGALKSDYLVVALESNIIAHGMPYPKNIEVALSVEEEVRKKLSDSYEHKRFFSQGDCYS